MSGVWVNILKTMYVKKKGEVITFQYLAAASIIQECHFFSTIDHGQKKNKIRNRNTQFLRVN